MALLDPDDRHDHDIRVRFSAREYLIVMRAIRLRNSTSFAAGVRELALEAARFHVIPAPVESEGTVQSLTRPNNTNDGEATGRWRWKPTCRLMRKATRLFWKKPAGAGSPSARP